MDARFPTGRTYGWLALAVAAFAIYGSLLPFDFRWVPLADAGARFRTVMTTPSFGHVSRTNFLANLLLFVPIGFGVAGALLTDRDRRTWRVIRTASITLAISAGVSVTAEFLQVFFPGRVPSKSDVQAQLAGALVGLLVWVATGPALTSWLRRAHSRNPGSRLRQAFVGYAGVWAIVNLAPFDITVDLGELSQRVHSGMITLVPFASAGRTAGHIAWDAFATVMSAIPLAGLGLTGRMSGARRRLDAFVIGATLVVLIEIAQIFLVSHAADITDVIFGWMGVAVGAWVLGRALEGDAAVPLETRATPYGGAAAVGAWCIVLAAYHWMPYDFTLGSAPLHAKLAGLSLVPFNGYNAGSYLVALNDLLTKLGLAAPLGVIVAFVTKRDVPLSRLLAMWIPAWLVIFGVVEAGQLFLPSRFPDPTDVLVGVVGAAVGLGAGRWLRGSSSERSGASTRLE